MPKLRRRHIDAIQASIENLSDRVAMARHQATARELQPEAVERLISLLDGVRLALERMGGTTLPGFRGDISELRAQMAELQHEMSAYHSERLKLFNLVEALHIKLSLDNPEPAIKAPKRRPGRPKKDTSQKLIDEPGQEVADEA